MSEFFGGFIGFMFACGLIGTVNQFNSTSDYNIVRNAINECQKELPRNVKCVITAVPEVKK